MWIFLNNSFVSAVEHNTNPDLLVVRARVEGDIERFFGGHIAVERHEDRDYLFRTIVPKVRFADCLASHATQISYPNFKNSIAATDQARHNAYLRVWSAMNDLQGLLHRAGAYVASKYNGGRNRQLV